MNDRERIIELLVKANLDSSDDEVWLADHLIANGVTSQKHGEWIAVNGIIRCSECNAHVNYEMDQGQCFFPDESKYCHNCGAKMKEEKTVIDKEKIYVITKGDYSYYHIITATTDKKLAEAIAERYSSVGIYGEKTAIEIYEDAEIMMLPTWRVTFDENGALIKCSGLGYEEGPPSGEIYRHRDGTISVYIKVADETTAIKAAAEKRAMYIAREEGL